MTVRSPYADIDIPDVGLPEFLFSDVSDHADSVAVIDGPSGREMTFGELAHGVDRFAAALGERGLGKGDVIALFAPNNAYYPVVFHGGLAAGVAVSTINAMYTPDEVAFQLRDSGSKVLVTISAFLDRARAAVAEEGVVVSEIILIDAARDEASTPLPENALADLLTTTAERPSVTVTGDDVAALPYSSGTTGRAKGVVLTHRNLIANLLQVQTMGTHVSSGTKILAVLPFFHIYGMTCMMNQGIHARAAVVTMPKFELAEFLRIISEYRIDRVYVAPPIAVALAKHPMVEEYDIDCVDIVFSGAAALDAELGHAMGKRLNCTVLQGYGMTELSPVSHCMPDDRPDMDLSSIGVALPNVECKLVDPETGEEGPRGELWVKGPNVMREYLNNADATSSTLDSDGFLHTGDVATVTDEGVFYIVDRVKELIKYKGYQVPPAELEALLLTNDSIADAAVIGVKDADGEEIPKAFVVKQQGAQLSEDDVMSFVASRIAPHKKVRVVEFIDEIPKSGSGKILRKDLRARENAPA
ncbi:AMP-binding protein [Actinomycetospora endophytica]|uniref:AMP-binding protein n=1 Tax=Actinomycetospora endophytica TaxID=2291215 RepID=A0ABS8P397_9PSEU|nr:AMP-binding protein [Actinomycetospora endophytica]MCD2192711.1 AMP-binding protein [Actinomycetospora endophytica]